MHSCLVPVNAPTGLRLILILLSRTNVAGCPHQPRPRVCPLGVRVDSSSITRTCEMPSEMTGTREVPPHAAQQEGACL
ncbi:hypothetical protein EYF80_039998 [Liparis tanakae]|uniref:Secreted protein n=1 Tax=Liparis tanakae TaxID=230148 RepID=A0A4Z2GAF2_9TELE|nr:hypothetical protein EYF80_039998 [Liparis tanakae]